MKRSREIAPTLINIQGGNLHNFLVMVVLNYLRVLKNNIE